MAPSSLLLFRFSSVWVTLSLPLMLSTSAGGQGGDRCSQSPVLCGNLSISSPFGIIPDQAMETSCGGTGFQVGCANNIPYLGYTTKHWFQIRDIFYDNASLLIADVHKLGGFNSSTSSDGCHIPTNNTPAHLGLPFSVSPANHNLIFYNCTKAPAAAGKGLVETRCGNNTFVRVGGRYGDESSSYGSYFLEGCDAAVVPVLGRSGRTNASRYQELISDGFLVTWQLPLSPPSAGKGLVETSCSNNTFVRVGGSYGDESSSYGSYFLEGCDAAVVPVLGRSGRMNASWYQELISDGFLVTWQLPLSPPAAVWYRKGQRLQLFGKKASSSTEKNIEALIVSYGSLAPKRYNYSEVMKITSFLDHKLGEGGYGVVYKGRLHDDRQVAVKFLRDCKGKGEEFVNEVMSIGRTSHVNIVSLFGFCLERSKRALIYEYMPSGSLDQYIYSENPKEILGWQKLYMIAIGIARGLEYLHHSCNTRIVHFDIKPPNILLDHDFSPKIADFGLAKLCHTKESKLSMTGTRGTIGFIAPEVHSRTFGVVSTKSDVYSYGMKLLEMVGGRKNVKSMVEKSSQKYFPDWIYEHFAHDDGLEACEVTCEVEEIARKMILIGLWCVQVLPTCRPTMSKVMEMFERHLDELDMPPKQNFSQMPEDLAYTYNTGSTSFGSHTKTQAFSEVTKTKKISVVNSNNFKRLPTL
ncbi:unnamed protein product [Urochloa decumbens]|uniref:Protein kinase domain-containing protein n=1 Tax=Urochloa decumbens TaxID=240449 RepID=A0ABC8YXY8_9POAL